ncbi:MAG: TadE/TadG family type IV pilus assembly protein [Sphingomonadaceae bacterium]
MIARPAIHRRALLRSMRDGEEGTAAVEFGLICTVFFSLLLGVFDMGQAAWANATLQGAAQEAARASSLESGDTAVSDAELQAMLDEIAPGATITSSRRSYYDFDDIDRPEQWNDDDGNGTCNNGESYIDENGSGSWDADIGKSGNGGANDVVMYTVSVEYDPIFPNPFADNGTGKRRISTTVVRKNQPFDDQQEYGADAGTC